jgi:hypothetical protein
MLLIAALALGGLPFGLLVWRPAWRAARRDGADCNTADAAMLGALRRLILVGGALFLLANLLSLVVQAAAAADVPLEQATGAPLIQLLSGRPGLLWLARVALTFQIVVLTWRLPRAQRHCGGCCWRSAAWSPVCHAQHSIGDSGRH